jgi:hypothetical protein
MRFLAAGFVHPIDFRPEAEMTSCTQVPGASSRAPANTRRTGQPVRRNSFIAANASI